MSDQNKTARDIENRIESKQDDLRKNVDALEEKMSPENLKAQARERAEQAKEQVKEQAVDATRQAGEAVRDKIDDASRKFRNSDRTNMPSLSLVGLAAVIGIGLILVGRSRKQGNEGHYTRHPDSDYRRDRDFIGSSDLPPARTSAYDRY